MKNECLEIQFVVCVKNGDCEDLELRKIYQVLPDEKAAKDDYIRVIDESGEDYLYPMIYFYTVELSPAVRESFRLAA